MLNTYLVAPKSLNRLRSGPSAAYMDGFADALERDGYSAASAIRYLRAADHLGRFMQVLDTSLADVSAQTVELFYLHLPNCTCSQARGGRVNHHNYFGAKRFRDYLVEIGICPREEPVRAGNQELAVVSDFRSWLQKHRGARAPTIRHYCRDATAMLEALGNDLQQWDAHRVREFLLDSARHCKVSIAEKRITSTRAFLRYLSVQSLCQAGLDHAVPALAHWRLASLPRCLSTEEVDRLIAVCEGNSCRHLRDRAIVLLLVRLGLRAGDLARLRLSDVEWKTGTLRVLVVLC